MLIVEHSQMTNTRAEQLCCFQLVLIDMFECTFLLSYQQIRNSKTVFRKISIIENSQMISTRAEQLSEAMVSTFINEFWSGKLYPDFARHLGFP